MRAELRVKYFGLLIISSPVTTPRSEAMRRQKEIRIGPSKEFCLGFLRRVGGKRLELLLKMGSFSIKGL